jgi:cytochrome c biogenesis protein CcmG, thiol:disulfide interchange protein DsbE
MPATLTTRQTSRMKRWLAVLPVVVLGALALLFGLYGLRHDPHVIPDAMVGKPAPVVALAPLAGGAPVPVSIRKPGERVRLVNFFASWCVPCVQENGALVALKAAGVPITGVAYKDKPTATRAFLARLGDPFEVVLLDPDGTAGVEYGVSGVPETFAIDASGKVLAKHSGELTPEIADRLLASAH